VPGFANEHVLALSLADHCGKYKGVLQILLLKKNSRPENSVERKRMVGIFFPKRNLAFLEGFIGITNRMLLIR
jgi:hypothetical protein